MLWNLKFARLSKFRSRCNVVVGYKPSGGYGSYIFRVKWMALERFLFLCPFPIHTHFNLKIEASWPSETFVFHSIITGCHNPADRDLVISYICHPFLCYQHLCRVKLNYFIFFLLSLAVEKCFVSLVIDKHCFHSSLL